MKYKLALICFIIFIFNSLISFADESAVLADTKKKEDKGIDLIVVGGLGLTTAGPYQFSNTWGHKFYHGPAISLGLEVPFTKAQIFSIQVYGNYWIAKWAMEGSPNQWEDKYFDLSNGYFSQLGVSAILKYYLVEKSKKIRVALHLGGLFYSPYRYHSGLEVGYSIYYNIDSNLNLNLFRRFIQGKFGSNRTLDYAPGLLMLNVSYKFNLEL